MLKSWVQNQDIGEIVCFLCAQPSNGSIHNSWGLIQQFLSKLHGSSEPTLQSCFPKRIFYYVGKVPIFQLEKLYGKSSEAKAFISELRKGFLPLIFHIEYHK